MLGSQNHGGRHKFQEIVETLMSQLAQHVPRKVRFSDLPWRQAGVGTSLRDAEQPRRLGDVLRQCLGTVPQLEMEVIAGQVMNSELGPRIKLLRLGFSELNRFRRSR